MYVAVLCFRWLFIVVADCCGVMGRLFRYLLWFVVCNVVCFGFVG